jgi:guanine deaminase
MLRPEFQREAIRLSVEKRESGAGGPFGALVVRDGEIVERGWNQVTSTNEPTAHAEVVAIRDACSNLNSFSLASCELNCSCEPCPLCLAAAYWARIGRIYFAASCDDATAAGFDDRNFYRELCASVSERSIPMLQSLREETLVAFDAWRKRPDRIQYLETASWCIPGSRISRSVASEV